VDYVRSEVLRLGDEADQVLHHSHVGELDGVLEIDGCISDSLNNCDNGVLGTHALGKDTDKGFSNI
jgi:hypothetical protein